MPTSRNACSKMSDRARGPSRAFQSLSNWNTCWKINKVSYIFRDKKLVCYIMIPYTLCFVHLDSSGPSVSYCSFQYILDYADHWNYVEMPQSRV